MNRLRGWILIALILKLLSPTAAQALYLDSGIFVLESDQTFFSRQLLNNTDRTNLYAIQAWRIDRPGKDEARQPVAGGELMYTPLKKILPSGSREFFKLFYRGPQDDKERYYRIVIRETPTSLIPFPNQQKKSVITPVVALDTIMVVRPRKMRFDYHINAETRTLTNRGNTFFQVMIHRSCEGNDDSAKLFNLLPGEQYTGEDLAGAHRRFIIGFGRYIKLGEGCGLKNKP